MKDIKNKDGTIVFTAKELSEYRDTYIQTFLKNSGIRWYGGSEITEKDKEVIIYKMFKPLKNGRKDLEELLEDIRQREKGEEIIKVTPYEYQKQNGLYDYFKEISGVGRWAISKKLWLLNDHLYDMTELINENIYGWFIFCLFTYNGSAQLSTYFALICGRFMESLIVSEYYPGLPIRQVILVLQGKETNENKVNEVNALRYPDTLPEEMESNEEKVGYKVRSYFDRIKEDKKQEWEINWEDFILFLSNKAKFKREKEAKELEIYEAVRVLIDKWV